MMTKTQTAPTVSPERIHAFRRSCMGRNAADMFNIAVFHGWLRRRRALARHAGSRPQTSRSLHRNPGAQSDGAPVRAMTKPKGDIKILLTRDEWREIEKHIQQNALAERLCLAPDFEGYGRIQEILDRARERTHG